ncbi:unnamed protein product, partial [Symbiodinium sp. CCMP2456]
VLKASVAPSSHAGDGPRPRSQGRPATSPAAPAAAVCSSSKTEFTLVNTPREVVIRSRCLMQRGSAGPRRVVLPRELVPVGSRVEHDNSGEACTSKSRCVRATLFVGGGLQTVPVELVSAQRVAKRQVTGRAGAGPPIADKDALRHDVPPLTPELRGDLKQKLDSLVSVCRTDFKAHPRSVRFFLRELWEVCQLLKVPCLPRPYRKSLAGPLQQFVMNIPNWLPADLAPSSAELSEDSFITLTVMLALDSIPWEFKFNQTTYRLCNCRTTFGSHRCLLPTGRLRPSEFAMPSGRSLSRSGARQRRVSHSTPNDQFQGDVSSAAGYSRMDLLQKQERHLSTRLLDVSAALRVRFLEFVQQVPVFLEDLLKCTVEKPVAEQIAHQRLLWDRWANLVISEITAFDKSYTQFERLYMTIVEQLMETTLEPLRSMAKTCAPQLNVHTVIKKPSSQRQEKGLVASFSAAAAAAERKAEAAAVKLKEAEAQLAAKAVKVRDSPPSPSLSSARQEEPAPLSDSAPPPGHYTSIGLAAVADKKYQKRFAISIASQRCYAKKHGYEYAVIDPSEYPGCDKFRDFFFRKHCSVARFLETTSGDHILFVFDGDNPVVWLDRGLDHWLKEVAATDVVLYERWMNNEIMAGNYAVRNSDFGIRFLDDWASFEEELPRSGYHSSDNGAIHLHLLRVLGLKNEKPCKYQWDHLGSDRDHMDEYYGFVTCTRLVMGAPRRWKIAGTPRVTILPRGHAWAIDGGDADSHVSSVGAISHHGQKTEANYRQYFQDSFVDNGGSDCDAMVRKGFYVDPRQYGESLLSKLKARTDGAMLDWTRQHVPPWDFAYLGCMATLSCRPLDDGEALSVSIPRPMQSSIPFKKVPKDAKFEVCAGEWETCKCAGFVYFGTKTRRSPVVEVQAGEGKIDCRADNFDGDPAIGEIKKCAMRSSAHLEIPSGRHPDRVVAAFFAQIDSSTLGAAIKSCILTPASWKRLFRYVSARRMPKVLQMETYAEVQEMARALIQDFESLCKVLLHLNDNQAKPELKENAELTSAILRLEQVWADCQFILHQGCLDFIEVLEREVLPQLSPMLRWQIRIALGCSEGRPLDPDVTQADRRRWRDCARWCSTTAALHWCKVYKDIKAAKVSPRDSVSDFFGEVSESAAQLQGGALPDSAHDGLRGLTRSAPGAPSGIPPCQEELWRDANPEESSKILRSRIYDDSKPTGLRSLRKLQSPKELTAALSELGRRQRWHDALSAMQILAHAGRSWLVSIEALNAAITCCSSGTWQGSLALLSTAKMMSLRHSLVTAGAAIKAAGAQSAHGSLADHSKWHNALHLLSCMRQHSMIPNIRHHNAILYCSLSWSTALCIFKSVLTYELEPTEFTSSLLMKKLETNWPLAIHSFLSMQRLRLEHDAISGNAALRAGAGNRRVSREFLQHLISAGVPVDSATCSSAGSALDSERIWDLLQDVRASVVQPDLGAYTSVLGAFDNDGRWEAALGVLRSMAMDGVQASLNPYAAAQSACERCRQWMEVVDLIRALKGSSAQLDLVVRSAAISAPQTGGSWQIALQSFCQLALETLAPDVVSHGAVLSAAEAGHQWHSAISALWSSRHLKPDVISCNSAVSACEKAKSWVTAVNIVTQDMAWCRILPDAISCSSAILACTDTSCWGQGLLMVSFAQQQDITPQVGSFGALLTECERASPSLVACQQELLSGSLRAAGRKLRFVELCCPQDDRHHTLRRDFGKFDEKRFNEFRTFITDDEQNRGGANRQTDFFRLVYRQLKAVAAFPVQENFAAAVLAASKAQENLKQPGLSDQDIAVVQREQELLEGGARWICLMLKVQAVAPGLFPKKPPGSQMALDAPIWRKRRPSIL